MTRVNLVGDGLCVLVSVCPLPLGKLLRAVICDVRVDGTAIIFNFQKPHYSCL